MKQAYAHQMIESIIKLEGGGVQGIPPKMEYHCDLCAVERRDRCPQRLSAMLAQLKDKEHRFVCAMETEIIENKSW